MPAFNQANYISHSIRSALSQTWADFELIVVNDGSTDDTSRIVSSFTDERIRLIYQTNQGLAAARNVGIRYADGEFLAFLDADDEWEPTFIEVCLQEIEQHQGLAGVYALSTHIDQDGHRLPMDGSSIVTDRDLYQVLLEGGFFPPCSVIVRASVVRNTGLFDTQLSGHGTEDWDLWLRISRSFLLRGIPQPLARYRIYPGSMSTNAESMHACRISVLIKQFGPPEGNPSLWPTDKRRAFGFAFRTAALDYVAQSKPVEGWRNLLQAIQLCPCVVERVDTFYELALGDQPRGYRGEARGLDITGNAADILDRLNALFTANPSVREWRRVAYCNAYLAFAMLSDQAGDWVSARHYLACAIRSQPRVLGSRSVARRWIKLLLGRRLVDFLFRYRLNQIGIFRP